MTSVENSEYWNAQAKEERRRERESIATRLEAGEEIDLLEAMAHFEITQRDGLWSLADLIAVGRIGDETEAPTEIPPSAWLHLRMVIERGDFIVVTTSGKRIFDLRFRAHETQPADREAADAVGITDIDTPVATTGQTLNKAVNAEIHNDPPMTTVANEKDLTELFQGMVSDDWPDGRCWTKQEYADALAAGDLSLKHNDRVQVSIGDEGRIIGSRSSTLLVNTLLISRFAFGGLAARADFAANKRGAAKVLYLWLMKRHRLLVPGVTAEIIQDRSTREGADPFDTLADRLVEKINNHFFARSPQTECCDRHSQSANSVVLQVTHGEDQVVFGG